MNRLDGRTMAAGVRATLAGEAEGLRARGIVPALTVVVPVDDPAAHSYIRTLERAAAGIGVSCNVHRLSMEDPAAAPSSGMDVAASLVRTLDGLGADESVDGVIVQAPLPAGLDAGAIGAHIPVAKDVDGLNPTSMGRLALGLPSYPPATAAAVLEMLRRAGVALCGARAVVIGRSAVVGKPVALLLLQEDATVTVCHSRTDDLAAVAREADVLVVAIGRARHVGASYVKPGATVIDVGINAVEGGIVGDVDYDAVAPIAGALSPVPGGVGPLTAMMLLRNTVAAARARA